MRFLKSLLCFALLAVSATSGSHVEPSARGTQSELHRIIDYVNSDSSAATWTAAINSRWEGKSFSQVKRQLGAILGNSRKLPLKHHHRTSKDIPESFDARKQWPQCPSIGEIRDQSDCGSCWAFGAVEAGTDRICISTNGEKQVHLSATDLLGCCDSCGFGCGGGDPGSAWNYFTTTGVVTGGNYGDFSLCSAYPLPICDHHVEGKYSNCDSLDGGNEYQTPACPTSCDSNSTYTGEYQTDKTKFATAYSVDSNVEAIQQEIMTHGPVETAFSVYADFLTYKTGVYQHVTGSFQGGHAVKMIGWGVEDGTPYWLIANSWNNDWGDNGLFKILRGSNECGIESEIVAGLYQEEGKKHHHHHHKSGKKPHHKKHHHHKH